MFLKIEQKNMNSYDRRNFIINEYKNNFKKNEVKFTLDFDIQKNDSSAYKMALIFASNNVNGFNVMKSAMLNLSKNIYFEYRTHEQKVLTIFSGHEIDIAISEMANIMLSDLKCKRLFREEIDLYCKILTLYQRIWL